MSTRDHQFAEANNAGIHSVLSAAAPNSPDMNSISYVVWETLQDCVSRTISRMWKNCGSMLGISGMVVTYGLVFRSALN